MKVKTLSLIAVVLVAASACASSGGRGVGAADETKMTHNLGRVTYATLSQGLDKIFRKYAITVYRREEQYATIYIETEWMMRDPLEDEIARGATAARTRFIIEGRRSSGPVFRTTWTAENQLRTDTNHEWQEMALTDGFKKWVRGIIQDVEAEIRTGVR